MTKQMRFIEKVDRPVEVIITPITIYKSEVNNILMKLCFFTACMLLILFVFYDFFAEYDEKMLSIWCIPFFMGIFSSLLLAIFINWESSKYENERIIRIRSEVLHPVFYELSVYFSKIAKCAIKEYRSRDADWEYEYHTWQEWTLLLYAALADSYSDNDLFEKRKEEYKKLIDEWAKNVCDEVNRFCVYKDMMRISGIIERTDYNQICYIRNVLANNGQNLDALREYQDTLKAQIKPLELAIEQFPDFRVLNSIKFGKYGIIFVDKMQDNKIQWKDKAYRLRDMFLTYILYCKCFMKNKIVSCRKYITKYFHKR